MMGMMKRPIPIEVFEELPSTNAELLARGRAGAPHGAAIRACTQTAGRGQRAHTWASPEGGLYLSVLVRPRVPAELLPGLPVACSLGILHAVHLIGCREAKLKWPNDVVVGTRKLAGILLELGTSPEGTFAVCGVGVNIRAPKFADVSRVGAVAALEPVGLADLLAPHDPMLDIDELAERMREEILDSVAAWQDGIDEALAAGNRPVSPLYGLQEAYRHALAYHGAPVRAYAIDGDFVGEGILADIDEWGRALVLDEEGVATVYDAAAVSIRGYRTKSVSASGPPTQVGGPFFRV